MLLCQMFCGKFLSIVSLGKAEKEREGENSEEIVAIHSQKSSIFLLRLCLSRK